MASCCCKREVLVDEDEAVSLFVVMFFCFMGLVGESMCSECLLFIVYVC